MNYEEFIEYVRRIAYVPGTEVESEEFTEEEFIMHAMSYAYVINAKENESDAQERAEGKIAIALRELLSTGKYESKKDALLELVKRFEQEKTEYDSCTKTRRELLPAFNRAEHFLSSRELILRKAFLPYLEAMLIAGLKAKKITHVWTRASFYGFSSEPFDWSKGERFFREDMKDFPYSSMKEMKEKDREAFEKVATDVYYSLFFSGACRQIKKTRTTEGVPFIPSPKEGYSFQELADLHRDGEEDTRTDEQIVEDLYQYWDTETDALLPILLFRLEEAIYYALKFHGDEYKKYLESLNVAEDFALMTNEKQ